MKHAEAEYLYSFIRHSDIPYARNLRKKLANAFSSIRLKEERDDE